MIAVRIIKRKSVGVFLEKKNTEKNLLLLIRRTDFLYNNCLQKFGVNFMVLMLPF